MAGVQENLKELEGRITILLSDIMDNRVKMLNFEMELEGTKVKLEETGKRLEETEKRLEETEKKQEETGKKLKKTEEKLEKTMEKQEITERKLMETEKKREKAESKLHEHLSRCQPASSSEDVTIREELKDLGNRVDDISDEIVKVKHLKSLCEMSMVNKAKKSITEADRIDDGHAVVNIVNDDIYNELEKATASMSKQLKQVTAPDNQGQPTASQALPMAITGQPMATTGQITALQGQTSASQGQPNTSQVKTMARVNPHYYYSVCMDIEVDHANGILSRSKG